MLSLIPIQYRAWAALLLAFSLLSGGFYSGHHWAMTKADAARAKLADAHIKQIKAEIKRSDVLAGKLSAAEGRIVIKTVEVIKHVPQVTTGTTPCLSGAAVRLLNYGTDWGPYQPAGEPAAESPAHAAASDRDASDRDVAYWIATANQQYETCAGRLNALVDWHDNE